MRAAIASLLPCAAGRGGPGERGARQICVCGGSGAGAIKSTVGGRRTAAGRVLCGVRQLIAVQADERVQATAGHHACWACWFGLLQQDAAAGAAHGSTTCVLLAAALAAAPAGAGSRSTVAASRHTRVNMPVSTFN